MLVTCFMFIFAPLRLFVYAYIDIIEQLEQISE